MDYVIVNGELMHYGVKGMKWGVRRYTNEDGSLTRAGERKKARLQKGLNAQKKYQAQYDNNILRGRKKNRTKLEAKYDRKIARNVGKNEGKVKALTDKKAYVLKDFDDGTSYIKKALKIKNDNYNGIAKLKIKALTNPEIKNSKQYKKAKQYANSQLLSDNYYGKAYTTLMEAHYVAVNNGKSWTRGVLDR